MANELEIVSMAVRPTESPFNKLPFPTEEDCIMAIMNEANSTLREAKTEFLNIHCALPKAVSTSLASLDQFRDEAIKKFGMERTRENAQAILETAKQTRDTVREFKAIAGQPSSSV